MNLAGKPSQMTAFNARYSITAGDGRGESLFGNSFDLARDAYERTLIGDGFPAAYIEFPLPGLLGFALPSIHGTLQKACADGPTLFAAQFDREDESQSRFALCCMLNYAKAKFAGTVAQPAKFYLRMYAGEVRA